ncbi:MAG TPA: sensor histidine kinase [Candidatus Corynebacterium gallistercoris]|uniref:Sensor histidine kinase n=1 Tax=Candidatus Corynebacterium gallistercoris TaxID=2838530 RepID=A0A9D1RYS8_9CORY|nr:sensor histidine kinase [Candidatus Corynebacterium gallistercoris]
MDHTAVHSPRRQVDRLDRLWEYLGYALHVLVAMLVAVVVLNEGLDWRIVVFAGVYAGGLVLAPRWLWLLLVVVAWSVLVFEFQSASFIAFALFFLAIGVVRPQVAIPVVVAITAIAVGALARFNGWTIGGVIGPLVGAGVAVALGLGFRLLRREAIARAEASHHAGEMGERARVAADIHDTVAQGLSSIQMLLFSVERRLSDASSCGGDATSAPAATTHAKALEEIRLARVTAEENLAETRRIIAALQPAPLEGADLPVALARVCSTTPMGPDLSFDMDGEPFALPERTQEALVRIVQSLVSNVVRHANASQARVTLTYQPGMVAVDVVDNGQGFDASHINLVKESSVGLPGVLRRAQQCGGTMEIETGPGEGCGVSVHIPAHGEERP